MTKQEFIDLLKSKGYAHKLEKSGATITHNGYVYLDSLTALPEGIKFENHGSVDLRSLTTLPEGIKFENHCSVFLESLTTLPEGIKFENHGSVYLESLTTLPEGIKFENHGYVNLRRLTALPEGIKFENHGSVNLDSLTALPEGIKFENHGSVFLNSLTGTHTYLGKPFEFRHVDGHTMVITGRKTYAGHAILSARFFAGGPVSKMNLCYIVEGDGLFSHGDTMKSAVEDLQFKISANADKAQIARDVAASGRVTLAQFRGITGACREGVRHHLAGVGIVLDDIEDMPLTDALKAMSGTSYGDNFKRQIEACKMAGC